MNPAIDQKKVSKYETLSAARKSAAGGTLAARLREKGWRIRDAADYLGVSRQRLYCVFADPHRARLWECAVEGIPVCTPAMAQALQENRRKKTMSVPEATQAAPEFEVGDGVTAMTEMGSLANEGEEGWIADIHGEKDKQKLLIRLPGGEDWFPVDAFHVSFTTNGKTHQGVDNAGN